MKKVVVLLALCMFLGLLGKPAEKIREETVTLAMCRPAVAQIQNIVDLYEKNLLTVNRLQLICVYHENEEDDYSIAHEYVKSNRLHWISFRPIIGKVQSSRLFVTNEWTPQFREIFERTDGIIFTGGMDIPPTLYGEENILLTEATTPTRSLYEISFLFHLVGGRGDSHWKPFLVARPEYPLLAICLGAQSLNVAAGGSMIQDIPSQMYKLETVEQVLRQDPDQIHSSLYQIKLHPTAKDISPYFHRILIQSDSLFRRRLQLPAEHRPLVLSSHHQAIDKLGDGLFVTATSLDERIVEAIEHHRFPNVLGVQFHPEPYSLYKKGALVRSSPTGEPDRNLRSYLEEDSISFAFHKKLWNWFAEVLKKNKS